MEIWKDIKGYEGLYQVSNLGNVKSLNYNKTKKEKVMKPYKDSQGYLQVELKGKAHIVHLLVARAFIPQEENKMEINHKDKNKLNNNVNNLEWCDRTYNVRYSHSKPVLQYDLKGNFIKEWECMVDAVKFYNDKNISAVCRGKQKTCKGYIWRYK